MRTFKVLALVDLLVTVLALTLVYNALHRDQVSEQLMVRSIGALKASDETLRLVIEARAAEQEYLRSEAPEVAASLERTEAAIVNTAAELTALLREDGKSLDADRLQAQIADTRKALGSIVDQTRNEGAPGPGQSIRQSTSLSMWALLSTTQDVAHVETEALRGRM